MFIYGKRSKLIKEFPLSRTICQSCHQTQLQLKFFQSYLHVFWIPFFPLKKRTETHCLRCQQKLKDEQIFVSYRGEINQKKSNIKTPAYFFIGSILFAFLLLWSVFQAFERAERFKDLLSDPRPGDYYIVNFRKFGIILNQKDQQLSEKIEEELKNFSYMIFKIDQIKNQEIYFLTSHHGYFGSRGARKAIHRNKVKEPNYFSITLSPIKKSLVQKGGRSDAIKDIIRQK